MFASAEIITIVHYLNMVCPQFRDHVMTVSWRFEILYSGISMVLYAYCAHIIIPFQIFIFYWAKVLDV